MYWNPGSVYGPLTQAFKTALTQTAAQAVKTAPVSTGQLRRSIRPLQTGVFSAQIIAAAPHAEAVEYGTKPHTIRPIRKKVLVNSKKGFGPVRGEVQHPGTSGQPFMHLAAASFRNYFISNAKTRFRL